MRLQGVVEGARPTGRGSGARRRASSVIVLARPSPRTRSRVACTSSRTPGRDSSAPSSSTVSRCVSRPTRCSSGATAASRAASVRAATQSSSAAVKTGEVKWSPSICSTARVRAARVGRSAAAAASSAPRTSVRCSTAATTRSFLVGKWCSWAPRLTPARSETSVVDVPAKPRSTSSSTVASSSRARIARVRSSCGHAVVGRHRGQHAGPQQTVKPDFKLSRPAAGTRATSRRSVHDPDPLEGISMSNYPPPPPPRRPEPAEPLRPAAAARQPPPPLRSSRPTPTDSPRPTRRLPSRATASRPPMASPRPTGSPPTANPPTARLADEPVRPVRRLGHPAGGVPGRRAGRRRRRLIFIILAILLGADVTVLGVLF